ncbi:PulJ/GspJ family protein [Pseudoalteromonas apostichopi]|uniref:PulJ/GspJ family protein n=1 Tax=Pseudoalteromonas apostichopi TaxID=3035452 RepID=UPI002574706F|nr:type II secretion system protein [Pseudoalteromonas sp. FE4]
MFIGKIKRQGAFTLVEVLIAMVIFSLVMTLAVSSYRYSILNLTKQDKSRSVDTLTTVKLINNQVRSLKPFFHINQEGAKTPFFVGEEKSMLFITESPIIVSTPIAIAALIIENNKLEYCEVPFGNFPLHQPPSSFPCGEKLVYLDADEVEISYFGWKNSFELDDFYSEYLNVNVKPSPKWYGTFKGNIRGLVPMFVKIASDKHSDIILKIPEVTPYQLGANNAFEG